MLINVFRRFIFVYFVLIIAVIYNVNSKLFDMREVPSPSYIRRANWGTTDDDTLLLKHRVKRADNSLVVNTSILPDESHNEAIVHWSGEKSQVMFLLTRAVNENATTVNSTLYRSSDYGSSFQKIIPGKNALIHYFYVSPRDKDKLVFVDLANSTLYVTLDEGDTFLRRPLTFSPDRLLFHPNVDRKILAYSNREKSLYVTVDLGESWSVVQDIVNPRFYWAVPGIDDDETIIHMECEDPATGKFRYHAVKEPYPTEVSIDSSLGYIDIGSVMVQSEYIFAQKTTQFSSHLYVSYYRQPFRRAFFPNNAQPSDFAVVEANEHQVFIAASHQAGTVTLYLSDVTGQYYIKSLDHLVAFNRPNNFLLDLYEVNGMPGTYIVNQYGKSGLRPRTLITFNQGGNWQPIPAPADRNGVPTNCRLPDCSLYLHLQIDPLMYALPMPLSDENAPGLILAQGTIGNSSEELLLMSQDGGLTWTAVMNGTYRKSILDQGGAIVLVPANAAQPDVTKILYSCTEGKRWETYVLDNSDKMRVDGLLNEPGISSLVTNIYGHTSSKVDESKAGWIVVKLNFSQILSRRCNDSDYYTWVPSSGATNHSCLLGQKLTFERRKPDVECFNGIDYERAIDVQNCTCLREDFECDYGYELNGNDCVAAAWFDASVPTVHCEPGETFQNSSGYRKVAADKCTEDSGTRPSKFDPVPTVCPVIKPQGLGIEVVGGDVAAVNLNVTFLLTQDKGSHSNTSYLWEFGDGASTIAVSGFDSAKKQTHVYKRPAFYVVKVTASNARGSESVSIKIWVQDKLSGLHFMVSHAVQIDKPTNFEVLPIMLHPRLREDIADFDFSGIHFLWMFGDETADKKGELSWSSTAAHTYSRAANYTVWVEAFTGVGSIFRSVTLPVYGTLVTVQLVMSGLRLPFGLVDTVFEDLVAQSLRKALTAALEIDESRLDVEYNQIYSPLAQVSILPQQQTSTEDSSIDEFVSRLLVLGREKSINFTLPDEAYGVNDVVTIVSASIADSSAAGTLSKVGLAVGIPVLLLVLVVLILVILYYKKRLRTIRHYSVLHSRYRDNVDSGTSLLDDTDDDEPLMDAATTTEPSTQQRLALSDEDDDPLCARIILSETSGAARDNSEPANC